MKRIAFWLRKLADFFDPWVKPTPYGEITIRINVDSDAANRKIAEVTSAVDRLVELNQKVNLA